MGSGLHIENIVDLNGQNDTELAMRIQTDVQNTDQTFFTDLNGFQVEQTRASGINCFCTLLILCSSGSQAQVPESTVHPRELLPYDYFGLLGG